MSSQPRYSAKSTATEVANDFSTVIRGKVILTTGVSPGGLGASFVEAIAKHSPRLLILAGRDGTKIAETAAAISSFAPGVATRTLELDLGSQAQIRAAAAEVNAYEEDIDVLVNNAGVMACPYGLTKDSVEIQFGTNHVGHFLFTNLIMAKLLQCRSGEPRIVSVSSDGYRLGPVRFDDLGFDQGKTYNKWRAYGQAKSANMLFAVSLAEKLAGNGHGLTAVSLHPGVIGTTNLGRDVASEGFQSLVDVDRELGYSQYWNGFQFKTLDEGTATHVYAAFAPELKEFNGAYLEDSAVMPPERVRAWARDKVEAQRLWELSEGLVGEKFGYEV